MGAFPAALVAVNPLRCSPIGALLLLYGVIGVVTTITYISRTERVAKLVTSVALCSLCGYILGLQRYIFHDAALKYADYGFYGLQMGEHRVFEIAQQLIRAKKTVHLTHGAFNGNEQLAIFYLNPSERSQLRIMVAHEPCILPPGDTNGVWIIREELFLTFLSNKVKCADVTPETIEVVKAPNDTNLFRVLSLSRQPTAGFDGPPA